MVLYRKYRPQKLAEVVGQEHVTKTLLSQLESGKIAHGYLFTGPRGTGKTSTARILAKAVNCNVYRSSEIVHGRKHPINEKRLTIPVYGEPCNKCTACKAITDGSYLDLIEIDAASNRGIDEIRDLREKIRLSPVEGRFKVYIVDEVHMLTTEANNALLKTLEEPPAHAIFVLCTTEPNKLPETIVSRLLRFSFKRAKNEDLKSAVVKIAKAEKIPITDDAIAEIVRVADGSYRDALSILDQVSAAGSKVDEKLVGQVVRTRGSGLIFEFAQMLVLKNLKGLATLLEEVSDSVDLAVLNRDLVMFFEKVMHFKLGVLSDEFEDVEKYQLIADQLSFTEVGNLTKALLVAEGEMKLYPHPRVCMLLAFAKWCGEPKEITNDKYQITNELNTIAEKDTKSATPRKSASGGKIKLEDIEAKWGEFLAKVRPINAHVVALLRSARPKGVVDGTLILEVFFRFHKEKLEEPKIMEMLSATLSQMIGQRVSLRMELAVRSSETPAAVSKSDVAQPQSEDLSKIVEEIFLK